MLVRSLQAFFDKYVIAQGPIRRADGESAGDQLRGSETAALADMPWVHDALGGQFTMDPAAWARLSE